MIVTNSTSYDTAALDGIATLVKPRTVPDLPIVVRWLSGHVPYGCYIIWGRKEIRLWIPRRFPRLMNHGGAAGYVEDFLCLDWQRFAIYVMAHEYRHAWQDQSGKWPDQFDASVVPESFNRDRAEWERRDAELENDADRYALAMLARYG